MPEVLRLIGEGKSQREVAAAVGVSAMTINRWLKRPA
jgi:transposase